MAMTRLADRLLEVSFWLASWNFFFLVAFCIVGPHHPQAGEVFPGDPVQIIGESLNPFEPGAWQR